MPNFNGQRLFNVGDPIQDKDSVNLRFLNKNFLLKKEGFCESLNVLNLSSSTFFSQSVESKENFVDILYISGSNFFDIVLESKIFLTTSSITSNYIVLNQHINYYGINYFGNVDVSIPDSSGLDGLNFFIKDESGFAGINRIRLIPEIGKIDGSVYYDINLNYGSLHIIARDGNWWII